MRWIVVALLLCVGHAAHSQGVQRCVAPDGKVTFTQAGCGTELIPEQMYDVYSPPPSGVAQPEDAAPRDPHGQQHRQHPERHHEQRLYQERQPSPAQRPRVTIVGGSSPTSECSTGLNDRDLRTAMVRGEIVPGMTRKQVASMYGPVNRNAPARGAGVTTYWNDKYVSQTSVRYDSNGCATSSWQSGHGGR